MVFRYCLQDLPTAGVFEVYCTQMWCFQEKPSPLGRESTHNFGGVKISNSFIFSKEISKHFIVE